MRDAKPGAARCLTTAARPTGRARSPVLIHRGDQRAVWSKHAGRHAQRTAGAGIELTARLRNCIAGHAPIVWPRDFAEVAWLSTRPLVAGSEVPLREAS